MAAHQDLLGHKVRFLGAKSSDEVRSLLTSSAFSVVSSRYETFCMAAAESLAAGRPVVSTRCGGPEGFIDETVGLLVDNDDPRAMADGIEWMLERFKEYDPLRLNEHVRCRFSEKVVVEQLLRLYARVRGTDEDSEVSTFGRK